MKKIFLVVLFNALITGNLQAQAKQQRMLLEQIAALKVYIGYAQKGYSAVKKGLNTIGDFKRGEFNLHTDYLNSLKVVNPKIKKYARVTEIGIPAFPFWYVFLLHYTNLCCILKQVRTTKD